MRSVAGGWERAAAGGGRVDEWMEKDEVKVGLAWEWQWMLLYSNVALLGFRPLSVSTASCYALLCLLYCVLAAVVSKGDTGRCSIRRHWL